MAKEDIIGKMLVEDGHLSDENLASAKTRMQAAGGKSFGEVLIEAGFVEEGALLRTMAKYYSTQYVTKRKLSKVEIPKSVTDRVPESLAEKYNLCPIQFKDGLTIIIDDPTNVVAIDEIKFVTGINNVRTLIALESTIRCGINKFYKGDANAFGFGVEISDEDED